MKRRKSKKSKFPHQLTIHGCPSRKEERIVTDAGFESIDYQLALKYFSLDEIFNYWECYVDFEDIELEAEIEQFEALANTNYYFFSEPKQQEFLNLLIDQFSWLPRLFDIATARSVYGLDYRWVKIIALQQRYQGLDYIDGYEAEAIRLGLYLKKELNNPNLSIINDNKHAVAHINGIFSFERSFLKDYLASIQENPPQVFWSPRKSVKLADRLSIHEATKIFIPDDNLEEDDDYFYEIDDMDFEL